MRSVVVWLVAGALAVACTRAAQAEIFITVDKSAQRMTVTRGGQLLYSWPVSTGRSGYATPSGAYSAFRMEAEHFSEEWDDAPMPHSIFFTKIGHAIHGTNDTKNLGKPVSHGCVRLSPGNAATLFALVEQEGVTKTKVMLTGSEQIALARRGNDTPRERDYVSQSRSPQQNSNADYPRGDYPQPRYEQRSQRPLNADADYPREQYTQQPRYVYPPYYDARPQYPQPQYVQPRYGPPGYRYPPGYGTD